MLFSIGAVVGVLVFAKTRVAPPLNLKLVDQYVVNLESSSVSFDTIKSIEESRIEYIRLDDKLNIFLSENVIDAKVSDEYRMKIDDSYGRKLTTYGFDILRGSVWPENKLQDLLSMLVSLNADKLTTEDTAVSEEFINTSNKICRVVDEYKSALNLAKNTSYNGINDASAKIQKAKSYRSAEYLRNNVALVTALNALPRKIAQSHYGHVSGLVNALGGYYNVSKDYYMNTLIPRADNAINEYKNTKIYGGSKPSVSDLENRAVNLVTAAMNYYGD